MPHPCKQVVEKTWPALSKCCDKFADDERITERACRTIRSVWALDERFSSFVSAVWVFVCAFSRLQRPSLLQEYSSSSFFQKIWSMWLFSQPALNGKTQLLSRCLTWYCVGKWKTFEVCEMMAAKKVRLRKEVREEGWMLGNRFGFEVSCECPMVAGHSRDFGTEIWFSKGECLLTKAAAVHRIGSCSALKSRWFWYNGFLYPERYPN